MRGRILRTRLRERVVVTTHEGASFDGVLYASDEQTLVLRSCQAVAAGDDKENVPLDGELLLFNADIAFIQRP